MGSHTFGLLPGRVIYVIDESGVVRQVFSWQLDYQRHVDEAQRILQEICGTGT